MSTFVGPVRGVTYELLTWKVRGGDPLTQPDKNNSAKQPAVAVKNEELPIR